MDLRIRLGAVTLAGAALLGLTACDPAPPTVEQVVKRPTTTAPAPKPTSAPAPAPTIDALSQQVVDLTNAERAKAGLGAVAVNGALTQAARNHSADQAAMAKMSHTGSNGSTAMARMQAAGFRGSAYGENVAYGYRTADTVMNAWMNSSGHRANILGSRFTQIGVGVATGSDGRLYWTMNLGG